MCRKPTSCRAASPEAQISCWLCKKCAVPCSGVCRQLLDDSCGRVWRRRPLSLLFVVSHFDLSLCVPARSRWCQVKCCLPSMVDSRSKLGWHLTLSLWTKAQGARARNCATHKTACWVLQGGPQSATKLLAPAFLCCRLAKVTRRSQQMVDNTQAGLNQPRAAVADCKSLPRWTGHKASMYHKECTGTLEVSNQRWRGTTVACMSASCRSSAQQGNKTA